MIELRWKEILSKVEYNNDRPVVKKVLQYRQMIDKTVRTGLFTAEEQLHTSNYQWSDWQDVPTIQEIPN